MKTTARNYLSKCGFVEGSIFHQPTTAEDDSPGWSEGSNLQGIAFISMDDPILDEEFDDGYGSPDCPRIIAFDLKYSYIVCQYDGSTWMQKFPLNSESLFELGQIPYPGNS